MVSHGFHSLPNELVPYIGGFLTEKEAAQFCATSRKYREFSGGMKAIPIERRDVLDRFKRACGTGNLRVAMAIHAKFAFRMMAGHDMDDEMPASTPFVVTPSRFQEIARSAYFQGYRVVGDWLNETFELDMREAEWFGPDALCVAVETDDIARATRIVNVYTSAMDIDENLIVELLNGAAYRNEMDTMVWLYNTFTLSKTAQCKAFVRVCASGRLDATKLLQSKFNVKADDFGVSGAFERVCRDGNFPMGKWMDETFNLTLISNDDITKLGGLALTRATRNENEPMIKLIEDVRNRWSTAHAQTPVQ
jgi:hypothetical protein